VNYLVSYVNDKGNEQKEIFESTQMVSGFVEQLLHMNQARPEDIKIFTMEQVGFHVETIPVVKIDTGEAEAPPEGGYEPAEEGAPTYEEAPPPVEMPSEEMPS
jgi:hypothetical protein